MTTRKNAATSESRLLLPENYSRWPAHIEFELDWLSRVPVKHMGSRLVQDRVNEISRYIASLRTYANVNADSNRPAALKSRESADELEATLRHVLDGEPQPERTYEVQFPDGLSETITTTAKYLYAVVVSYHRVSNRGESLNESEHYGVWAWCETEAAARVALEESARAHPTEYLKIVGGRVTPVFLIL